MAKWGYLARAYAISEYAMHREQIKRSGLENGEVDDSLDMVKQVIWDILRKAEINFVSAKETPYDYRLIKQCKKFLEDF